MTRATVLVFGYGNPARQDDGLGPALAEAVEAQRLDGVDVDADYQLTVEDAAAVAEHDVVIFADAAVAGPEPFYFEPVAARAELGFSSHGCNPAAVTALADELFGAETRAYVLGIRGYAFEPFTEQPTEAAARNLAAARDFILELLRQQNFNEAARRHRRPDNPEEPTCETENT